MRIIIIKMIIVILILTISAACNGQSFNIIIQMSSTNETYYQSLPTFVNATYNSTLLNYSITSPLVFQYNITAEQIVMLYNYYDDVAFWGLSRSGIILMLNQQSISANYSGIILYDSNVTVDGYRSVILYQYSNNIFQFNVAQPSYENYSLSIQILSTFSFTFSDPNVNQQISQCQQLTLSFVYNMSYVMYCMNGSAFLGWNITSYDSNSNTQILQSLQITNTTLNISQALSIQDFAINPLIYLQRNLSELDWSFVFSTSNLPIVCSYTFNLPNCSQLSSLIGEIQNLGSMISEWIEPQSFFMTSNYLYILQNQRELQSYAVSSGSGNVFITNNYIYVETIQNSTSYLLIYDKKYTSLMYQFPFNGKVFVIEGDIIFVSYNQTIAIYTFETSYFVLNSNSVLNLPTNPYQFSVTITSPIQNITYNYTLYVASFSSPYFFVGQTCSNNNSYNYTSTTNILLEDLTRCHTLIGPLLNAYLGVNPSNIFTYSLIRGYSYTFNLTQAKILPLNQYMFDTNILSYIGQSTDGQMQIVNLNLLNGQLGSSTISVCNFTNVEMSVLVRDNYYLLSHGLICKCDDTLSQCNPYFDAKSENVILNEVSDHLVVVVLDSTNPRLFLQNDVGIFQFDINFSNVSLIKNISVNQINQGRIAMNLYNNTVVVLVVNISNPHQLAYNPTYWIQLSCPSQNSTEMLLQKSNQILICYCYNQAYVWQYAVNNTFYTLVRAIPLYNFIVNDFDQLKGTSNYYVLPVTLTSNLYPYKIGRSYYLLMQFGQFTASTIKQLINSSKLYIISQSFDIILYNASVSDNVTVQYLNQQIWLLFTLLTQQATPIQTISGSIGFSSIYNYNYIESITVLFNLSASTIVYTPTSTSLQLNQTYDGDTITYYGYYNVDFEQFYGTITGYTVITTAQPGQLQKFALFDILMYNKLVGSIDNRFNSLISLDSTTAPSLVQTNLTNLIVGTTRTHLVIFEKVGYNSIDLYQLASVPLKNLIVAQDGNCILSFYSSINSTACSFLIYCDQLRLKFPATLYHLIVINYTKWSANVPSTLNYSISDIQLPRLISNVENIETAEYTLSIGSIPQSSNSLSSSFLMCNLSICGYLTNFYNKSTYISIDFDTLVTNTSFVIVNLDLINVNFWISPNLTQGLIAPTFNISLMEFNNITDDNTYNFVKMINSSGDQLVFMLGASTSYYLLTYNLSSQIISLNYTYTKYFQCAENDQHRPQFTFNQDDSIQMMVIYCTQNIPILRYNEYLTIAGTPTIYTSYIQIFHTNSLSDNSTAIRVVPSDSIAKVCLFVIYGGNTYVEQHGYQKQNSKILFQQIGGILVDARLKNFLGVRVIIEPETGSLVSPSFSINFTNNYFFNLTNIQTEYKYKLAVDSDIGFIGVFLAFDLITIGMIIYVCVRKARPAKASTKMNSSKKLKYQFSQESNQDDLAGYYQRLQQKKEKHREDAGSIQLSENIYLIDQKPLKSNTESVSECYNNNLL